MVRKPNIPESELEKAEKQFEAFDDQVKSLTTESIGMIKPREVEPQTKLSQKDIEKSKDIYLKPSNMVPSKEKFNEKFRDEYNFDKEYVNFIAEHKEVIGDTIELWTKPYPGLPAEFWKVPSNKPVWGPRYLADQIKRKIYRRLKSEQSTITAMDGMGQYNGHLVVDTAIQRLDAYPVSSRKSLFMGANSF